MSFSHKPVQPKSKHCENAFLIFEASFTTCESFLNSFEQVRKDRNAKGASTDLEQDLLRAMLVFACSGLDAVVKQLIKDALPTIIEKHEGAESQFRDYIHSEINKNSKFSTEMIAMSITSRSPREQALARFMSILGQNSLQSKDQIFQVTSFFDIPSKVVYSKPNELQEVFQVRNKIVHELDIDLEGSNRKRNPRGKTEMIRQTNIIFQTTTTVLDEVDKRCM
jgi:hypothetical protein